MPRPLNIRQQRFVQLLTTGPDGVKGNATACYKAAGYVARTNATAQKCSVQLLSNSVIQAAIVQYHRTAAAQTVAQLKDWKESAPLAQNRITLLASGYLPPDPDLPPGDIQAGKPRMMRTRDDAAIGAVMGKYAEVILERAYPEKLTVVHDFDAALQTLAQLLGLPTQAIPLPVKQLVA